MLNTAPGLSTIGHSHLALDDFLGLLAMNLSMGQWLSAPMILIGATMMLWAYRRKA